jgi:hypothetical protein
MAALNASTKGMQSFARTGRARAPVPTRAKPPHGPATFSQRPTMNKCPSFWLYTLPSPPMDRGV